MARKKKKIKLISWNVNCRNEPKKSFFIAARSPLTFQENNFIFFFFSAIAVLFGGRCLDRYKNETAELVAQQPTDLVMESVVWTDLQHFGN